MELKKELEEVQRQAAMHYQQWQQDIGATNMLLYLIDKQKQETLASQLEVKE